MKDNIWVIDDDEIYQQIIRKFISRAGVFDQAFFYMNAMDALRDLEDPEITPPQVILLDINMPQMDGWQFLESVEKFCPFIFRECDIYIVTSSIAYSDKEKKEKFSGLAGFLSKPLRIEQLVEIAKVLK